MLENRDFPFHFPSGLVMGCRTELKSGRQMKKSAKRRNNQTRYLGCLRKYRPFK
jgi:hypothetical protein